MNLVAVVVLLIQENRGAGSNNTCGDGGRGYQMQEYSWNGFGSFALAGGGGGGGYNTIGGDGLDGGGGGSSWSSTAGGVVNTFGSTSYAGYSQGIAGAFSTPATAGSAAATAQIGGSGGARSGGGGGGGNHQALGGNGGSGVCIMAVQAPGSYTLANGYQGFQRNVSNGYALHTHSSGTIQWSGSTSYNQRDLSGNFSAYIPSNGSFPHVAGTSTPLVVSTNIAEIDTFMSNGTALGVTLYPEDAVTTGNYGNPYPNHRYTGSQKTLLQGGYLTGTGSSAYRPGYIPKGYKPLGNSGSTQADISARWLSRINFGFTVEIWFRPTASGTGVLLNINGNNTPNVLCQYSHSFSQSGQYIDFIISSNGFGTLTHRVYGVRAARTTGKDIWNTSAYTWKHLVFRYDPARYGAANQHGLTLYGSEIFMDGLNATDPWYGDYYGSSALKYQGTGSYTTAGIIDFGGFNSSIVSSGIGFSDATGPLALCIWDRGLEEAQV